MHIAILSLFIPVMVTIFGCPNSLSAHTWSWMFNLNPKLLLLSFLHKNQDIFLFFHIQSVCIRHCTDINFIGPNTKVAHSSPLVCSNQCSIVAGTFQQYFVSALKVFS